MARCPECKKQIDHLVIDVDASCRGIFEDEKMGYDLNDLTSNIEFGSDFMCPECGETLFLDEQEAIEFMNEDDQHHGDGLGENEKVVGET